MSSSDEQKKKENAIEFAGKLVDSERQYASQLDTLLQHFWIPLVTQGLLDATEMPAIFGNVEIIATAHVQILDSIDAVGAPAATPYQHALQSATCVVRALARHADDEAMLLLYKEYGDGLLERVGTLQQLLRDKPALQQFVAAAESALPASQALRNLLVVPRLRVNDYYGLLRALRRQLPKKDALEAQLREVLPRLRKLREEADRVPLEQFPGLEPMPESAYKAADESAPRAPPIVQKAASTMAAVRAREPPTLKPGRGVPRVNTGPRGPPPRLEPSNRLQNAPRPQKRDSTSFSGGKKEKKGIGRFAKTLMRGGKDKHAAAADDSDVGSGPRLYGLSLVELAGRERRDVPVFVSVLCNVVEAKGLDVVGIFRVNESKPVELAARNKLELGVSPAQAAADPIVAASLIKQWLRELPDPLFTYASYDKFIALSQVLEDPRAMRLLMKQCIQSLPQSHRAVTETLFNLCNKIVANEPVNRMSPKNLSIVLAPNILRPRADASADHTRMVREMQDAQEIVTVMIEIWGTTDDDDAAAAGGAKSPAPPRKHQSQEGPLIVKDRLDAAPVDIAEPDEAAPPPPAQPDEPDEDEAPAPPPPEAKKQPPQHNSAQFRAQRMLAGELARRMGGNRGRRGPPLRGRGRGAPPGRRPRSAAAAAPQQAVEVRAPPPPDDEDDDPPPPAAAFSPPISPRPPKMERVHVAPPSVPVTPVNTANTTAANPTSPPPAAENKHDENIGAEEEEEEEEAEEIPVHHLTEDHAMPTPAPARPEREKRAKTPRASLAHTASKTERIASLESLTQQLLQRIETLEAEVKQLKANGN